MGASPIFSTIFIAQWCMAAQAVSKTAASEANGSSSTLEWATKSKNISMQFQSQAELDVYNNNLVDTNVHLMGDATVVAQVV